MQALRRYRVGVVLVILAVVLGILMVYRLKDQQARAVQRPRGDTLVGIVALYVMVETRFPRRVESPEISLTPQGESA